MSDKLVGISESINSHISLKSLLIQFDSVFEHIQDEKDQGDKEIQVYELEQVMIMKNWNIQPRILYNHSSEENSQKSINSGSGSSHIAQLKTHSAFNKFLERIIVQRKKQTIRDFSSYGVLFPEFHISSGLMIKTKKLSEKHSAWFVYNRYMDRKYVFNSKRWNSELHSTRKVHNGINYFRTHLWNRDMTVDTYTSLIKDTFDPAIKCDVISKKLKAVNSQQSIFNDILEVDSEADTNWNHLEERMTGMYASIGINVQKGPPISKTH